MGLNDSNAENPPNAKRVTGIAAFFASLLAGFGASAQDATTHVNTSLDGGSEDKSPKLAEIIVTARRRAENVQDVPLSIDVVTADEIDRRGLVGESDYLRGMAGVNQLENPNGGTVVMRGIDTGPEYQNYYVGPTVATYFGESPTTTTAGTNVNGNIDLKLVDIERVEVLRGPQGTAFGDGALAGAVRTIPVAPKLDSFEGKLTAGYSDTSGTGANNYTFQAVANFPLIEDRLAIRAVVYRFSDSGFYRNNAGSDPAFQATVVAPWGVQAFATNEQHVGGTAVPGGRIAALFKATDNLRFTLSYLSQRINQNGWGAANSGTYDQTVLRVAPEEVVRGQTAGSNDMHIDMANAVMEYQFSGASLLATYTHTNSGDRFAFPDTLYGGTVTPYPTSQTWDDAHHENIGEIRLVSKLSGAWNYVAGLYAEGTTDNDLAQYAWYGNPAQNVYAPGEGVYNVGYDRRSLRERAGFGEVSWNFLPGFTLTGGLRTFRYHSTYINNWIGTYAHIPPDTGETADASGTKYRANLSYKPNDNTLLYAGMAQGFRLGRPQLGVQPSVCDPNNTGFIQGTQIPISSTNHVNADSLTSYELGGKFELFDHRLTIDTDVFHMIWDNIPISIFPTSTAAGCFPYYIANAGRAKSDGTEFQAKLQVTRALRADVGASYVAGRLTQDTPDAGLTAGMRLTSSPQSNANLGLQYGFDVVGSPASVRADAVYVGPFYINIFEQPNTKAGDYVKLDLSARFALRDLNLDLYVHNVTDNDAFIMRNGYALGTPFFGYRLRPRTVGFQLGYKF